MATSQVLWNTTVLADAVGHTTAPGRALPIHSGTQMLNLALYSLPLAPWNSLCDHRVMRRNITNHVTNLGDWAVCWGVGRHIFLEYQFESKVWG